MRIHSLTPIRVDAEELARRRARYARLAPPGVEFALDAAPEAAPAQLAAQEDVEASTAHVAAAFAEAPETGAALRMPDCVLDPAVPLVPDQAAVPIVGMLRLTASHLVATGRKFGAVTRNQAIGEALAARVEEYGFGPWFAGVAVLDLDFAAISDPAAWHGAVRGTLDRFAERGVGHVINGCSAVDTGAAHAVALVDPAALALRLLAAGDAV
ncbi:aspartate/glutamate racemase family protein [Streptomyces sulphureus]|uniref:aspartate/glutamate racemase family protein n=1 Tax=Streptomyces sulphureus TaxID=47758 RepID=UPI000376DAA3|nr:aspartate/glutamate racemase family protein [Streptomyces sulphureus]